MAIETTWKPIGLTDPFIIGPRVRKAQQLLDHNPFGDFYKGEVDGEFGPITAYSTRYAKWLLGYPKKKLNSTFGARLYGYLTNTTKLPLAYQIRRKVRLKVQTVHPTIRENMVKWCRWGIANQSQIHYAQVRPILFPPAGHLSLTTDCSGSTILFAKWAGVPAHPGIEYNGAGSSLNMGGTMRHISRGALQIGDLVCWPGHHVCVVIELGDDPLLESHGQEGGPDPIRLSTESAFHRSHGAPVFLSLL